MSQTRQRESETDSADYWVGDNQHRLTTKRLKDQEAWPQMADDQRKRGRNEDGDKHRRIKTIRCSVQEAAKAEVESVEDEERDVITRHNNDYEEDKRVVVVLSVASTFSRLDSSSPLTDRPTADNNDQRQLTMTMTTTTTTTSPHHLMSCNETTQLLQDPWFWGGEVVKLILAPSSLAFNLLFLYLLSRSRCLHVNVRNLLGNISACLVVSGLYLTAKGIVTIVSVFRRRPCWISASHYPPLCSFQTGVLMTTVFSLIASFFALQVERFYAAMQMNSYDDRRRATCSIAILFLIWTGTILCTSAVVATIPTVLPLAICNEWLAMHSVAFAAAEAIIPTMQVFGISLFVGKFICH
ncbi:unnamed protein product [Soboliphyme baturini]|uniref:G_PROTEIN_RECEP_F1_2 domain-containing protein n=1 Tax=Soboliphyme baturini TaxID=241478 RepID=A0A183J572_9BILA|nr:unnamed protein product [Soboliphyme baturini]